ncbi:hypothetical protein DPMN_000524 [Dreissena polymorpha]|uniref:Uncharacterized protein n=1 Tax=Dreissena polymorpha TaxID=45954 RepID=A0A9D4RPK3_DREPO|nr:hypothetical protein DPMN_000524 [Dreissena polymorpha]
MDHYFNEQNCSADPYEFRREQSRLYQKLHPGGPVLDLPKRNKTNFRLFNVVAALTEKVTRMDPVIQKLINKVDFNALDIIMEKSKELFQLLKDETQMPVDKAQVDILSVELTAGG